MEISLTPQTLQFAQEKVKTGQFESIDDLVNQAIEMLRREEEVAAEELAELRAEVQIGLDELNRGEGKPWDAQDTIARLKARHSKG